MSTLLVQSPAFEALERSAELAVDRARQLGRPALLTYTEPVDFSPDPLAFLAASSALLGDGVLWMQPLTGETFAGAGAVVNLAADGPGRFGTIRAAIREIQGTIVGHDPKQQFPLIGGFAFEDLASERGAWTDFPGGRLIVPCVVLQSTDGHSFVRVTGLVSPLDAAEEAADQIRSLLDLSQEWLRERPIEHQIGNALGRQLIPDQAGWEAAVATAVSVIREGAIDKMVLARVVHVLADAPFAPLRVLSRLREADATATVFAMQSGRSWFVGATPERLVRLIDGRVEVTCLAGSIGIGASEHEQRILAAQLRVSEKNIEEHEIVVRWTMEALEELCEEVARQPGTPRIAVARSVQHLETPLTARLSTEGQVLDLVEQLHPTPAVGGAPREAALHVIRELEEIERGWYAGPFGWTDLDGSGEFAVAIRSALISGRTASVYAGNGIVADSNPAAEYEETELKLRPMLAALDAL